MSRCLHHFLDLNNNPFLHTFETHAACMHAGDGIEASPHKSSIRQFNVWFIIRSNTDSELELVHTRNCNIESRLIFWSAGGNLNPINESQESEHTRLHAMGGIGVYLAVRAVKTSVPGLEARAPSARRICLHACS